MKPPKEQVPKIALGSNLSGKWNRNWTQLWRARMKHDATKGEISRK